MDGRLDAVAEGPPREANPIHEMNGGRSGAEAKWSSEARFDESLLKLPTTSLASTIVASPSGSRRTSLLVLFWCYCFICT